MYAVTRFESLMRSLRDRLRKWWGPFSAAVLRMVNQREQKAWVFRVSGDDAGDELAVDIGESEVAALMAEGEFFVIDAQ
jgi:hypothetical protein